jgi:hypothetical protein
MKTDPIQHLPDLLDVLYNGCVIRRLPDGGLREVFLVTNIRTGEAREVDGPNRLHPTPDDTLDNRINTVVNAMKFSRLIK